MNLTLIKKILKTTYKFVAEVSIFAFVLSLVITLFIKVSSLNPEKNYSIKEKRVLLQENSKKQILTSLNKLEKTWGKEVRDKAEVVYCLTTVNICPNEKYKNLSLVSLVNQGFKYIFNTYTSVSGVKWLAYEMERIKLLPSSESVYAQSPLGGIGLYTILPFFDIWKKFRDITYLILTLLSLIIGFLILFKVKLNPQTEITIQEALPKIVITLIFITISFPLVGFMIDLTYVSTGIVVHTLYNPAPEEIEAPPPDPYFVNNETDKQNIINERISYLKTQEAKEILNGNPGAIFMRIMKTIFTKVPVFTSGLYFLEDHIPLTNALATYTGSLLITIVTSGVMFFLLKSILDLIGFENIKTFFGFFILLFLGTSAILVLIVMFSGVILYFRLLGMFAKNLLILIFQIIFSPIIISFSALPNQDTIKQWIKNVIGCLIPYPITVLGLYVAFDITRVDLNNSITLPYSITIPAGLFDIIIPLLILFSIPNFVSKTKEFIGADDSLTGGLLSFSGAMAGAAAPIGVFMGGAKLFQSLLGLPYIGPRLKHVNRIAALKEKISGPADKTPENTERMVELISALVEATPGAKEALEIMLRAKQEARSKKG